MRTTVNIDDDLLARARRLSTQTRRSLGDIVDDALRVALAEPAADAAPVTVTLPTYGGSGLRPGMDLEDKDSIAALFDEDLPGAAR